MALDTKNKRLAVISFCQPQNVTVPDPDNELDAQDRAHLLHLARNIQAEVLNKAKRLAFMQFCQLPIITFPDPDGSFDVNDRRHILSSTRFEGVIISMASQNVSLSSAAPTLSWLNHEIFIPTGSLSASSAAPTLTPNWVANNWFNPFWVLPLADFSSRQGDWWGPPDEVSDIEIPTAQLALASEAPALVLESALEIVVPTAALAASMQAPSMLWGVHAVANVPSVELAFSSEPLQLYYEFQNEVIVPSADVALDTAALTLTHYPDHRFTPPAALAVFSSSAPAVVTRQNEISIPSADLTLTGSGIVVEGPGIFDELTVPRPAASTGGRYGRPFVVPPKKKKVKPLPEGPGIAAVRVGDNVLVSKSPNVLVFSPPVTLTDTLRMIKRMDSELTQTRNNLTAEIKSFREAFEAREERRAQAEKQAEIDALEAKKAELEQQIAENQELMTGLLLLMVE